MSSPSSTAAAAPTGQRMMTANEEDASRDPVALQRRLHETVLSLPPDERADYLEATQTSPDLVESESNLLWFLRVEEYVLEAAATRLARYWKERKKAFGTRAFFPVTDLSGEGGCLTVDDVSFLKSEALAALENDESGKPVVFFDLHQTRKPDKEAGIRLMFYLAALLAPNPQAQVPGVVCVRSQGQESSMATYKDHQTNLAVMKTLNETMPMKLHRYHYCQEMLKAGARSMFMKHIAGNPFFLGMPGDLNCPVHFHVKESPQKIMQELMSYGLLATGLPVAVGGTWTFANQQQKSVVEKKKRADPAVSTFTQHEPDYEQNPFKKLKSSGGDGDESLSTAHVDDSIKAKSNVFLKALGDIKRERQCSIRDIIAHSTMRSRVFSLLEEETKRRSTSLSSVPRFKERLESVLAAGDKKATDAATVTALVVKDKRKVSDAAPRAPPERSPETLQEARQKAQSRNRLLKRLLAGVNKIPKGTVAAKSSPSRQAAASSVGRQETLRALLISKVVARCRNSTPVVP